MGISLAVQWLRLRLPMQEVRVRSLVGGLGSHMPQGQNTKTENRSNTVINSIKTLKMVHIKKVFKKNTHKYNLREAEGPEGALKRPLTQPGVRG